MRSDRDFPFRAALGELNQGCSDLVHRGCEVDIGHRGLGDEGDPLVAEPLLKGMHHGVVLVELCTIDA